MVRRTSKKSKKITLEDVKKPNKLSDILKPIIEIFPAVIDNNRIEFVRSRYLERLRENQIQWRHQTRHERADEHRCFHVIDHAPGIPHYDQPCFTEPLRRITGYCSICSNVLTNDFPEDYPEEFKFCCSCLGWARSIFTDRDTEWLKHALKCSPTIRKIYKRITLVG